MTKEKSQILYEFKTNIILGTKSCTYREHENLLSGKK